MEILGLDTNAAMGFCSGDIALYKELLGDFVTGYEKNRKELDESFGGKDWHEFEVKIHALKSVTKTIGAMKLSNIALDLEDAAEKLNEGRIVDRYPVFASEYLIMTESVKTILKNKA